MDYQVTDSIAAFAEGNARYYLSNKGTGALTNSSTVTDKGQTTVPKSIREALGVDYGGRIAFCLDEHNRVYVEREDEEQDANPPEESHDEPASSQVGPATDDIESGPRGS